MGRLRLMNRLLLSAVALLVLALSGCGSSSKASSSSATSSSAANSSSSSTAPSGSAAASGSTTPVTIKNLAFNPGTVNAKVGQTVGWANLDGPPHNVTYVSGPKFTSSSNLNTGDKFSLKLTQAGTIHYFCSIHPFMKATIVVTR